MYDCLPVCTTYMPGAHRCYKRALDPLELFFLVVVGFVLLLLVFVLFVCTFESPCGSWEQKLYPLQDKSTQSSVLNHGDISVATTLNSFIRFWCWWSAVEHNQPQQKNYITLNKKKNPVNHKHYFDFVTLWGKQNIRGCAQKLLQMQPIAMRDSTV